LVYRDVWPGIDLVYSGTVQRLKYMFVVHPGADSNRIQLRYRGADSVALTDDGRLEIQTSLGGFQDDKPYAYQEVDGQAVDVSVGYELQPKTDPASYPYGFHLGSYNPALPLIIDPTLLVYTGFIGGSGDDRDNATAVDCEKNVNITGETHSPQATFPDRNGFDDPFGVDQTPNSGVDTFIAKICSALCADLWVTKSDLPDPVRVGEDFTYTIAVTNNGPNDATGVVVTDTLPATKGTLVNTVSVAADKADPDIRDNTATARTVATLANLIVKKLQAVAAAIPGSDIAIDDTTTNNGKVGAGASVTRFYLSTDAKFDGGTDTFLSSRPIGPLAGEASSSGSTTVTIPLATAPGIYFVFAVADGDGAVSEINEPNNLRARKITITP